MLCPLLIAAGVSAEVYTVAGNNVTLFGTTWDPSNTANDMSTTDDVNYTFTKENVTLTAGTVEFKVVKGHSWGTAFPSSNYILNIPADAKYNVTITFNSSSSTVGATATKVEDVVVPDAVIDQVTISGDFGNWYNDLALEKTGDYTYQGVLDLTEKTTDISFKLTPTSSNSMIWIGPGQLTLEDENGWVSTASDGNFKLANSTSGYKTYTFTATWKHGSNAANGWTLKVEGKDKREEPIATTYTVAGTPDAIFGTAWDATNTANDMTENNGIYTFTKTGVELTAGDEIMFKVVENHNWDTSYGTAEGGNVNYKVKVTGSHDITITFDPTVGIPEITLTDDEAPAYDYTQHTYRICGTDLFGGWVATQDDATANPMTLTDGKFVWTKTDYVVTSDNKTGHSYRIRVDNEYKEDAAPFNIAGISSNKDFEFDKVGTYDITITFDPATATVSHELTRHPVPAKDYTVKVVNSGNWDAMNVYAWNDGGSITGEWPGTAATLSEEKAGEFSIYTYTFENLEEDAVPTGIIFNAGIDMPQTADLQFEDGKTYWPVTIYGIEGTAFGGWKDGSQYRGIERILTDQGNGIYTYTTDAVLTANTPYPYHVSVNGAWATIGIGGVDGNKEFTVDADGTYTLVVTLNTNYEGDGARTLDVVATLKTEDTYTIVGEKDIVNGSASWNLTETANDMTENEGVWTLTVEGAKLEAGQNYKYKMVKNHNWGEGEVPAQGDQTLTVEETAEYTITYTFDGTTLSYNATKTGEYTPEPVDGQELVSGDHKVVIKGVHYLNLTENNYVLTIKSEETMTGLGGSFWSINGVDGNDMRNVTVVEEEGKKLVLTVTSNKDPEIYTPLYVMMPDANNQVTFTGNGRGNSPVIEWQEEGEVTPVGEYKVKFVNMAGWETVKAHAWNNDGDITEWPGIEGTAVDNTTAFGNSYPTFEFTFPSEPTNVQFNTGNNTKELNFTYVEGALYSYDGLADKSIFLFTDDANQFKPAQTYDVAGANASYARKFTPGNVCTVVLPFAIGADVAKDAGKFYRINSIAGGYIRGTEETPAPYIPYIFIPAKEYPFTNIGIGQLPAVQNNSITTTEGYTLQFVTETTELASDASYDYYGFSNGKFVKAAYATVNPFRSYIMVAKSANAPATLIWTDDEATGISSLKADIQNGKADVYDLQGRRVLNPVRGLYIVNGKKVIVK